MPDNHLESMTHQLDDRVRHKFYSSISKSFIRRMVTKFVNLANSLLSKLPTQIRNADHVLIKYDRIAGTYVKEVEQAYSHPFEMHVRMNGEDKVILSDVYFDRINDYMVEKVYGVMPEAKSVIEIGAGELTTLVGGLKNLAVKPERVAALEMSWSRLKEGKQFASKNNVDIDDYIVGDLFDIPLADDSFDIVYTHYTLEQSPHRNIEALSELYRITKHYLILMELSYELGDRDQKRNILKLDYIRGIPQTISKMGWNVESYELLPIGQARACPAIHVIKKPNHFDGTLLKDYKKCPKYGSVLKEKNGHLYSEESGILYPIVDGIQCLNKKNGIVASKY